MDGVATGQGHTWEGLGPAAGSVPGSAASLGCGHQPDPPVCAGGALVQTGCQEAAAELQALLQQLPPYPRLA